MFWCIHAKKNLGEGKYYCDLTAGPPTGEVSPASRADGVERGVVHVTGDCVGCPDKWAEDDVKKWTAGKEHTP